MSNIPNSNRYQSTGRNNVGGQTPSNTPNQRTWQGTSGGAEARRPTPNKMPLDGKASGNAIWLWLAGLAFFVYLFPFQTLGLIAILIVAASLSAKG